MADYNSSYTGQQIDDGVGIALAVPSTYRTAAAQDVIDAGKAAASSVPNAGSVSSAGAISIKHDSTELFTIQLPLYNGGVS